jgi:pimeloyl-ACP methyl ester carboxylesterase
MGAPTVARRVDRSAGYWEEATFLEVNGSPVFVVTCAPAGPARGGVTICSSILIEHMTNYRREVVLARALAAGGIASQRFHYRGAGHSGGDESTVTLDSMLEDALAASRHLADRADVDRLAFAGARWGGLVAAMAARAHPEEPLVLWEPVLDTERYFREMKRARRVLDLKDARPRSGSENGRTGEAGRAPQSASLEQELERQGWADMLGFTLHHRLYSSGRGKRLSEVLADRTGPLLVVQFGLGKTLKPELSQLEGTLGPRGIFFESHLIEDEPGWFFPGSELRAAEALAEVTVKWLAGRWRPPQAGLG